MSLIYFLSWRSNSIDLHEGLGVIDPYGRVSSDIYPPGKRVGTISTRRDVTCDGDTHFSVEAEEQVKIVTVNLIS